MSETASGRPIRILAPAKVNLVLRVLDRRPDGYHNLWSLMQTVLLTDSLILRRVPRRPSEPGGRVRLACDDPSLPTDGRNLIVKAAAAVLARARLQDRFGDTIDIDVAKRIPMGGGLGGGSSDAAATILGLNHLLELGWPEETLKAVGAEVGSDVPFFMAAPTARVKGRGEDVQRLTLRDRRWIVLVNPGFPIETKGAYQRLAESRSAIRPVSAALVTLAGQASVAWEDVLPLMENDFESALAPLYPPLLDIKTDLLRAGADAALLSGSGATVFGLFRSEESARQAASVLARPGRRVDVAQTGAEPLQCVPLDSGETVGMGAGNPASAR